MANEGPSLDRNTDMVFADIGEITVKGHGFAQGAGSLENYVTITSPTDMHREDFNVQSATATEFKVNCNNKTVIQNPNHISLLITRSINDLISVVMRPTSDRPDTSRTLVVCRIPATLVLTLFAWGCTEPEALGTAETLTPFTVVDVVLMLLLTITMMMQLVASQPLRLEKSVYLWISYENLKLSKCLISAEEIMERTAPRTPVACLVRVPLLETDLSEVTEAHKSEMPLNGAVSDCVRD